MLAYLSTDHIVMHYHSEEQTGKAKKFLFFPALTHPHFWGFLFQPNKIQSRHAETYYHDYC